MSLQQVTLCFQSYPSLVNAPSAPGLGKCLHILQKSASLQAALCLSHVTMACRNQQPVFTVNEFGSEDKTHTTLIQLDICSLEFHFECLDILNGWIHFFFIIIIKKLKITPKLSQGGPLSKLGGLYGGYATGVEVIVWNVMERVVWRWLH